MADSTAVLDHKAWLGYLQPDGLVVSPAALVDAQVILDRNTVGLQQAFLEHVESVEVGDNECDAIADLARFAREFLGWDDDLVLGRPGGPPVPEALTVSLPEIGETMAPSLAVLEGFDEDAKPFLLARIVPIETALDAPTTGKEAGWSASAGQRFERLLRETEAPIGVLTNRREIRLIYAPRGESAGSLTFPVSFMAQVAGRPLVGALHMLLSSTRLHTGPKDSRLPALLTRSREYQSQVSTALAGQVLEALYELLRGFEAADARTKGDLLRDVLAADPDTVYRGLLGVLMRLVFLLYAEDRGLMPDTALYVRHYSVHGLFERLRADAERHPDIMDQRYGGWARLVALFGSVHNGCRHPDIEMPPRHGHLFDPERFPFLEGRTLPEPQLPLVSDGCLERVLRKLLILHGERLSYRTLDVEEIGSVYQTIMGFGLQIAAGDSIAIAGKRKHKSEVAAPVVIDLAALLAEKGSDRAKWLKERTGHDWDGTAAQQVRQAGSVDEMLAALDKRIARHATPHPVAAGGLVLQPTDERRRTGSHYTPRKLTNPIVRKTLEPVLKQLGERPTPDQILGLKVCDLAMGSGAFLVEADRQLADALVAAWHAHGGMPRPPEGEDEFLLAKRLLAQRCLYGVDRNPMAVDLAKLSLWLATLAKNQPFTFLDHLLRAGDSLVGLSQRQVIAFEWASNDGAQTRATLPYDQIGAAIDQASTARIKILDGGDWMTPDAKQHQLLLADEAASRVRFYGDLVLAAFFGADKTVGREALRSSYLADTLKLLGGDAKPLVRLNQAHSGLRSGNHPITPFHWEIEFPEVFSGVRPGFDAIVGNPPFAGKNTLLNSNREGYLDWLKQVHAESHGNADLVAHFFRRAFALLRPDGCFGLIATNTIGQGDTRSTGLRWICKHRGTIYSARRRYKWPGQAAVVVSVVHVARGEVAGRFDLDGRSVPIITAYLFHAGGHEDPATLAANADRCFIGSYVSGPGFTFDDTHAGASPLATMHRLIASDARNADLIHPYLGGEEILNDPVHRHSRYVISFGDMSESDARRWPQLMAIIEEKVKPQRLAQRDVGARDKWWQFARRCGGFRDAARESLQLLVHPNLSAHLAFALVPRNVIVGAPHNQLVLDRQSAFAVLQCRIHEVWARLFGSSMKDDLRYTPTDCFETFPFPVGWETDESLEAVGREYYEYRAALMVRNDEGLTKTYNRFHDPEETDAGVLRLRELHEAMDRAVLDAYGWHDIPTQCEFLLDYEDEEDGDDGKPSKRKKPWRYRWPDDVRDEVLARLLDLNAKRAEVERLAGMASSKGRRSAKKLGVRSRSPVGDSRVIEGLE